MDLLNLNLPITLTTASILGLMLIWLSARVIAGRVRGEVIIGDQGDTDLLYAIRTHANFTEYAPLVLILIGLLEATGANATVITVFAALFVVARILHVLGMGAHAQLKLRQAGVLGTFITLGGLSGYGLFVVLMR